MSQSNLKDALIKILKADKRLWDEDKKDLNQTLLLDLVEKIDETIIDLLLQEKELRGKFFVKIKDVYVFKTNDFRFFMEENKVDNSYTAYKNRIGLTDSKKFLKDTNDVVLDFPYKDCVLEGGQSTEEGTDTYFEYDEEKTKIVQGEKVTEPAGYKEKKAKRKEVFFNQILAQDEIDRLFDEKALVNWKRYTNDGEQEVKEIKRDKDGTIKENLIIKGNNLLALHSLKKQFTGKIKLIYIDPPYNTGNDGFKYNDNFNHSTWLTFMKNRLEVSRELLRDDGVIFVQCDDVEQAYLKILMDGVFGRENFINLISIKTKIAGVSGSSEGNSLQDNCEYLNFYAKNRNNFKVEEVLADKIELFDFIESFKEEGKSWKYTTVLEEVDNGVYFKSIDAGNGQEIKIFKHNKYSFKSITQVAKEKYNGDVKKAYYGEIDRIFRTTNAQSSIRKRVMDEQIDSELISIEYIPIKGKNKGKLTKLYYKDEIRNLITFLSSVVLVDGDEIYKLEKKGTLWDHINYNNITRDGDVRFENGKKPEELLKMIFDLSTKKGDIVLDYHIGSGTTCAVAHKMERQYIGIEQMEYIETIAVERLKKVIEREQSGISKSVNWQGGGDFIYFELAKWNETAKEKILACESLEELIKFFDEMYEIYFLNYNLKIKEFREKVIQEEEFKNLSLDEQKKIFVAMLDNNQMYVNKTEMADKKFGIDKEDQNLTNLFYNSEK